MRAKYSTVNCQVDDLLSFLTHLYCLIIIASFVQGSYLPVWLSVLNTESSTDDSKSLNSV